MSKAPKAPADDSRKHSSAVHDDPKRADLARDTVDATGATMTTDQGTRIADDQNSLKAGERGATLLEDFILREKITHFDHERIPERIVHARGAAAHGYFEAYDSLASVTRASFLAQKGKRTPVFVRFSTVAGSRGSTDLARDVRGFSVKFYTEEGNYDLVGNNIPVFFIQDAIKFPDLIHAVKPEPHNEIPQAASAHDTFWDFISLMPESMHMIMWAMSDRAIPRSYRMMEGFGVHTFRFVNAAGKSTFVKFHWKPKLGLHSVAWDEALKISGNDPDFHRRDLADAITAGDFPEWELGVQLVDEEDEHKFDFDLLDPTKLIPEEVVPVRLIGRMVLDRNPDNYFAETEQVAFHPGHVVPGIDFSNDPLLQGRLFSYTDTQLSRLGSPNFHELPINRAVVPVRNHQRDAHMRHTIDKGRVAYEPNSLGGGCPFQASWKDGGFTSVNERIDARKVRARSETFLDHFTQARMFLHSQSEAEYNHIVSALRFELGKVQEPTVRQRMLFMLAQVDTDLAASVAQALGIPVPKKSDGPLNRSVPADADPKSYQPTPARDVPVSPALSMRHRPGDTLATRKVAVLLADGFAADDVAAVRKALEQSGVQVRFVAPQLGSIRSNGDAVEADFSFLTSNSVLFDAIYVPGGRGSVDLLKRVPDVADFIKDSWRHCKAIAASGEGAELLVGLPGGVAVGEKKDVRSEHGVVVTGGKASDGFAKGFVQALAAGRHWERETLS
ncbi:MAG: catalase [Luteibacter sp.]|uniref:catalase n=1 Tax=Luteibacter sp. TaxID=1886636 RepID=UPI0028090B16|nr:catalase [Luteibacter sp.]MDQ7997901.1 catalase [Luteibacter sp.]MDQ8051218.1 catalase [Luteibacter sp.]